MDKHTTSPDPQGGYIEYYSGYSSNAKVLLVSYFVSYICVFNGAVLTLYIDGD